MVFVGNVLGEIVFSYLLSKSKHYFLICFIISTIVNVTCIYCRQILYLPTFIIQGAGAVQLLAVGYWFKQNELPGWTVFVGAIAWLLAMVFGGIDLYGCYYKLYPVSISGAIGGVYVLYLLSRNVVNMLKNICPHLPFHMLLKFVKWCGENSLVILCVHHFERWSCMSWTIMAHLPFGFEGWIMSVFRILLTLVLSYLFVLSKCKIEQMRKDRQMS